MTAWEELTLLTASINKIIHTINPLWFVLIWIVVNFGFRKFYAKFNSIEYINSLASLPDLFQIERKFWRNEMLFKAPRFLADLLCNVVFLFYTPIPYELKMTIFLIMGASFVLKSAPVIFARTNLILYFRDFFDLLTISSIFTLGAFYVGSVIVKITLLATATLLLLRTRELFFAKVHYPEVNNFFNRRYFTVELQAIRESHAYIDVFYKLMTALMLMTIVDFSFIIPLIGCHLFFEYLRKLSFAGGYSALTSSRISYYDIDGIPFEFIGFFFGAILATVAFFSRDVNVIIPISVGFVILMILFRKGRTTKFDHTHNYYLIVDPSSRVNFNKLAVRLYRRVVYVSPEKKKSIMSKLEYLLNGISNDLIILNAFSFHYRIYKSRFSLDELQRSSIRNVLFIDQPEEQLEDSALRSQVLEITEYRLNSSLRSVYCCVDFFDYNTLFSGVKDKFDLRIPADRIRLQMEASYEKVTSTQEINISDSGIKGSYQMPLEEKINVNLSLEGSKHNHYLLKFVFGPEELKAVNTISLNGIHELATIFRQMHEDPSPSTRFMEIINLCEILSCYCAAIIYSKNERTGRAFWENEQEQILPERVSFGEIMSRIRAWVKDYKKEKVHSQLAEELFGFLHSPLHEVCQFGLLQSFAFEDLKLGTGKELKNKVTVHEFLDFITGVRNKTRGHGALTKVDFEVYVELEVIILHMLYKFSSLGGTMISIQEQHGDSIIMNFKNGGAISIVPVDWTNHEKYLNTYLTSAEKEELFNFSKHVSQVSELLKSGKMYWLGSGKEMEIYNLENFVQVEGAKAYLYSETKKDGTRHFISYSTGKHSNLTDTGIDLE